MRVFPRPAKRPRNAVCAITRTLTLVHFISKFPPKAYMHYRHCHICSTWTVYDSIDAHVGVGFAVAKVEGNLCIHLGFAMASRY